MADQHVFQPINEQTPFQMEESREDVDGVASTLTREEPTSTEILETILALAEMLEHILHILQNSRFMEEKPF